MLFYTLKKSSLLKGQFTQIAKHIFSPVPPVVSVQSNNCDFICMFCLVLIFVFQEKKFSYSE